MMLRLSNCLDVIIEHMNILFDSYKNYFHNMQRMMSPLQDDTLHDGLRKQAQAEAGKRRMEGRKGLALFH